MIWKQLPAILRVFIIVIALSCFTIANTSAVVHSTDRFLKNQETLPTHVLHANDSFRGQIIGPSVDRFTLTLQTGEFAAIRIWQGSGNVVAAVFAPDGSLIDLIDQSGAGQPEVLLVNASQAGPYAVQLAMFEWTAGPASYELHVAFKEPAAKEKSARAAQWWRAWYAEDRPGAVALVLQDGKPVFEAARGLADVQKRVPLTLETTIDLASVSKQFTAYAIAQLIDSEQLRLDDPVQKFLPELPDIYREITVQHLLEHESGLRDWDRLFAFRGREIGHGISAAAVLDLTIRQNALNFPPGSKQQYSNTGYVLLALVIERITNMPFATYMQSRVLEPSQVHGCELFQEAKQTKRFRRPSYARQWPRAELASKHPMITIGSSALACSAKALGRWNQHYHDASRLRPGIRALVGPDARAADESDYVFGNWYSDRNGRLQIGHQGLAAGFRSSVHRFPDQNLAVIVLANDGNDATYERVRRLEDLFLGVQPSPLSVPTDQFVPGPPMPAASPKHLRDYVGTYRCSALNTDLRIRRRGALLSVHGNELSPITLTPQNDDHFAGSQWFLPEVRFERDLSGHVIGFAAPSELEGTQTCRLR